MLPHEILRVQLSYSAWASARLVETAGALSGDELHRDFQTADKSVLRTLVHIFGADRIWLSRMMKQPPGAFLTDADYSLDVLRDDWPRIYAGWDEALMRLSPDEVFAPLEYSDTKGRPYATPVWQVVLHVVNHATHHRGQVSGFLRAMGHKPPPLDAVAYYRKL